jgi:LITAF-like zinc ribbon domain
MNCFFGGGTSSRGSGAQTSAVTGVSSDYYSHHDLPVAVAVPMGSEGDSHGVTAYASPIPPPTNPAYKSTGNHEPPHAPSVTMAPPSVSPSAPPLAEVEPSTSRAPLSVASSPSRSLRTSQPPATRVPIGFAAPPTIIPANNTVVMPLVPGAAPAIVPAAPETAAHQFQRLPPAFGRKPAHMAQCPYCQSANVRTRMQTYPSWITWLAVLLIALVLWPLAWIPLVVDCAKTTDHYCPNCHALVGSVCAFQDACVKHRR